MASQSTEHSGRDRQSALLLENVSLRYGQVTAVRDLTLEVRHGEVVTLLGPSGSGKTTTLFMAAGFRQPSRGRVVLDGRDITHEPPHKRNIGLVFQNYALFPHRTVAENVDFPLRMRSMPKGERKQRVAEALATVRLHGFEGRYPRQLSGGQQQRVALARALVFDPPLLLMDEPLGALDKNLRQEMQFELTRLQDRLSLTVVYVTHDQEEALTLSDRICVMRDGEVEQVGTPQEIYQAPVNRFVASFVGDTNLIPGRAVRVGEEWFLDTDAGIRIPIVDGAYGPGSVDLSVRPERVRIVPAAASTDDDESMVSVNGTVSNAIYLGEIWVYELTTAFGVTLRARSPAAEPSHHAAPGDNVRVSWRKSDALVLD